MRIVIAHPDADASRDWQRLLAQRLPGATLAAAPGAAAAGGTLAPDGWADYAVGWAPPPDFFTRQPRLRAFFSTGAGVDHLLRHPGLPATLPIYRLEDAGMGAMMADYVLHALLDIAGRHDTYRRQQAVAQWIEHDPWPRASLPVGVLGVGVLGAQVARHVARAGFPVHGFARSPRTLDGLTVFHGAGGWPAFLAATRVLVVLAPRTPATENLVDARALAALRPGGWLINVARGALVVDADLLAALDAGRLEGAVLDVFRDEPLPAGSPLWRHPRVRITPHVSAPTPVAPSAEQVAEKLLALERGAVASGRVERDRGY